MFEVEEIEEVVYFRHDDIFLVYELKDNGLLKRVTQ